MNIAIRTIFLRSALVYLTQCAAVIAATPSPVPTEHLTVAELGATKPHWVYVYDESFDNEIDARVHLFDGDTFRRLGQIDAGYDPGFNLSPDGKTTVVATTYFSRGSRGARADVVEFTDNNTLAITQEIVLPAKRAQTLPSYFNISYSTDSHFLYVAYITPASSFGVLDPDRKSVLSEIDTAGCVLVIPSGPNRVSSMCESGRLLTVTLNSQGQEASRALSDPFFNPDTDPVFVQGVPTAKGYAFLSFLGEVHEVDLSGPQPAFRPTWSLVSTTERAIWRPGGVQVAAIHRTQDRLFVPMHRGGEGSHKEGGTEIWVFDLKTHARLGRWPLGPYKLAPVVAVQVSQDEAPVLFAATTAAELAVFDARSAQLKHVEQHLGQTPWFILNH